MRDEAGVAAEVRARPLPCRAGLLQWLLGPGRRLLPLRFGGEARAVRSGEGVSLEPGDVQHGPVIVVGRSARRPAFRMRDVVLLLPRPALVRPPLATLVAAALAEVHPRAVR